MLSPFAIPASRPVVCPRPEWWLVLGIGSDGFPVVSMEAETLGEADEIACNLILDWENVQRVQYRSLLTDEVYRF